MIIKEIVKNVIYYGAIDFNREYFDELMPLPDGTSYNSYVIKGSEKTVIIDGVDPMFEDEFLEALKKTKIEKVDYIVSNHAEQDHSGSIPKMLELYPDAKVVTNKKCMDLLKTHLHIPEEKFHVINDGDEISLGDKTLKFIFTPWVHWPETLVTYLVEDKILFSCDFFGSHLATTEVYATPDRKLYDAAKRYYAEIMMPFRRFIKKNIEKLSSYEIKMIAPSHGPIYKDPKFIIDAYTDWASDKVMNSVVIAYTTMHGSTKRMVDYLVAGLVNRGVNVYSYMIRDSRIDELAMSMVDAATVIIGTPTVLAGPHPRAIYAATLANLIKPKTKFLTIIGSYGWGGKTVDILKGMIPNLKVELLEPVLIKGYPDEAAFKKLDTLMDQIVEKHKSLGIM